MNQDTTTSLFQYWNRLRNGRPAPRRAEIEPSDIKTLLADTFILERDATERPIFRLAGTRLCAAFGRELKAYGFASLWCEKDRRLAARMAESAFSRKSVAVMTFSGFSEAGRSQDFEMLLLPLDGGRESPRVLGSAAPVEPAFWLGADPICEARMQSVRVLDPEREPLLLGNRPSIPVTPSLDPLADSGSSYRPFGAGRRIRHLVVYDGGLDGGN
ncbi:MAG: PAS domain-containing protein [Rhizobiaceae bacterium]|nr:PAS domain-containing protein [Rhizobiaceae bacterium]MCV0408629.1 PAS domain-containing protein [Rhizobiaceae bacterium]